MRFLHQTLAWGAPPVPLKRDDSKWIVMWGLGGDLDRGGSQPALAVRAGHNQAGTRVGALG